jgi:hypothetical protein
MAALPEYEKPDVVVHAQHDYSQDVFIAPYLICQAMRLVSHASNACLGMRLAVPSLTVGSPS